MTDRELDEALGALRSTLTVEPSPAFAAGVRSRIDRERPGGWAAGIVLSAVAAGVVLGVVLLSRQASRPDTAQPVARSASSSNATLSSGDEQTAATEAPVRPVTPRAAAAPARETEATSPRVRPAMPERVLEVLVPADERLALARLLADLDSGRVDGAALVAKPIEPAPPPSPPSELVIAPIEIPAIGGPGGRNNVIR